MPLSPNLIFFYSEPELIFFSSEARGELRPFFDRCGAGVELKKVRALTAWQRHAKSKIFNPKNIFNTLNPTGTRKKFYFKPKPDPNLTRKIFSTRNPTESKNFYGTILALKIFKSASKIRISIGYKDNFVKYLVLIKFLHGMDQASFNIFPKKSWHLNRNPTRTRRKLIFKPEPDPISGLGLGRFFFCFGYPIQVSTTWFKLYHR